MSVSNSGRRHGKRTTEDVRSIDVRQLHRAGVLVPGSVHGWNWLRNGQTTATVTICARTDHVVVSYQQSWRGGPWLAHDNTIKLAWTGCHYGGQRPWWLCPTCGRRVALLYSGQGCYACRTCFDLAYRSQRETETAQAVRRVKAIRQQLGWPTGILQLPGGKPKGMHWSTYLRLVQEHTKYSNVASAWVGQGISSLNRVLKRYS